MTPRRIIILVIVLIVVAFLAFAIYTFMRSRSGEGGDTTGNLPDAGDQVIPQQDLDDLADDTDASQSSQRAGSVLAYAANDDGSLTVVQIDGKIVSVGTSTTANLNNVAITDVVGASFSADRKKILVLFGSAGTLKASVFDVTASSWQALPGSYEDVAWAPQSNVVAGVSASAQGGSVVTLTTIAATQSSRTLATLRAQDLRITWQTSDAVIVYDRPSAYSEGAAWTIDTRTQTITPLIRETLGMDLAWNSIENVGIVFRGTVSNRGGALALAGSSGFQQAQFNFVTLPAKCSFLSSQATTSPNYLACGVPADQNRFANAQLPDRYYQKALFTTDRLVVIDLDTQGIVFVGTTLEPVDATNFQVAGGNLYFLNRYDNGLYSVPFQ